MKPSFCKLHTITWATLAAVHVANPAAARPLHRGDLTFQNPYHYLPGWYDSLVTLNPLTSWVSSGVSSLVDNLIPATAPAGRPSNRDLSTRYVVYAYDDTKAPTGAPDPSHIEGFNVVNLAFYTHNGGGEGAITKWVKASDEARREIKQKYADAGISLMVAVGGESDKPQSSGISGADYAKKVAAFVKKYQLDGVDLDYEEFDLFEKKKSVKWLVNFTNTLRQELGWDYWITHAPIAPWFSQDSYKSASYVDVERQTNDAIDWYNIQYYNQGKNAYTTCKSLYWDSTSTGYKGTSISEIHKQGKIPNEKLIIGKPGAKNLASNGWMSPADIGKCVAEGIQDGWKGGVMYWEYPGITKERLQTLKDAAGL
ncbi:unnamed protein product [Sympodiomycopsis kandeliae]